MGLSLRDKCEKIFTIAERYDPLDQRKRDVFLDRRVQSRVFFVLRLSGDVIYSGGPSTIPEGTNFEFHEYIYLFHDCDGIDFEEDIDVCNSTYDLNFAVTARYKGRMAVLLPFTTVYHDRKDA